MSKMSAHDTLNKKLSERTDALVFKGKWQVETFEEPANIHRKYFGLKLGFSGEPTAGIRCYVDNSNNLYITHEAVVHNLEIDRIGKFLEKQLPDLRKHTIYADNARHGTIKIIRERGYRIKAVGNDNNNIEDDIEYIRSFDQIIIHPRCIETIREFGMYSYKIDDKSGNILRGVQERNDPTIKALRYALEGCINKRGLEYLS